MCFFIQQMVYGELSMKNEGIVYLFNLVTNKGLVL